MRLTHRLVGTDSRLAVSAGMSSVLHTMMGQLTSLQLATALDVNLQKRMPPSKRRNADSYRSRLSELGSRTKGPSSKKLSKKKAKKLAAGTIAIEDGKTYDMSLWKAIYMTVWRQWWWAVTLNGIGSESSRPLYADMQAHSSSPHLLSLA
jgi:hypothetical protein